MAQLGIFQHEAYLCRSLVYVLCSSRCRISFLLTGVELSEVIVALASGLCGDPALVQSTRFVKIATTTPHSSTTMFAVCFTPIVPALLGARLAIALSISLQT